MSFNTLQQTAGFNSSIYFKKYQNWAEQFKKISNKTIFYSVYSPPEQCPQNELEFELESKLDIPGFEPTGL